MNYSKRQVVITGLGLVTALGIEVEENWRRLLNGESGIRPISLPDSEGSPTPGAGQVSDESWEVISSAFPEEAETERERRTLFALWAAQSAMKDSGLGNGYGDRRRYGVIFAAGLGINRLEDIHGWIKDGKFDFTRFAQQIDRIHPESLMRNSSSRPAMLIAQRFNLQGYHATITSACASASQAIGLALRVIRRGDADLMLAGGADSMLNPVGLVFFVLLGAAATGKDSPETLCRPFDRKRSGLVMGEGAGFVVLEERDHAISRGARIYAEIAGYGTSMDAYRVTAPHPDGEGAEYSMRAAIDDAQISPEEIDYINAHGTSTKLNDIAETEAIWRVFGEHARNILINSSKSMIGHLLAASGGPEFVYTVLSVQRDEIHPTINLDNPDPKCNLNYVPWRMRHHPVRAAISNSFGFGGQNASLVVKKYTS